MVKYHNGWLLLVLSLLFVGGALHAKPKRPNTLTPDSAATQHVSAYTGTDTNGFPVIDTAAPYAYLMDADTGELLLDKNGDVRMTPSSMTKMMTVYIVFEMLKRGDIKLTDRLHVSEEAWRTQGSKMFVELGAYISVDDLIHGVVISSGNDSCIVLAEGLYGSVEAFVEEMNRKAIQMGLSNTNFRNPDGMPESDHYASAHDLAVMALRTIEDFPEYYPIYAKKEFVYHGIRQGNRNPLLYETSGADGLKTGHTEAAGYGMTGSVVRDGRRLIMVLNGLQSIKQRFQESVRVIDWGFAQFENYKLFRAGETVDMAGVWLGAEKYLPLVVADGYTVTLPRRFRKDLNVVASYNSMVAAPISKGQQVGTLTVSSPGMKSVKLPLVAGIDVAQVDFFGRLKTAFFYLLGKKG